MVAPPYTPPIVGDFHLQDPRLNNAVTDKLLAPLAAYPYIRAVDGTVEAETDQLIEIATIHVVGKHNDFIRSFDGETPPDTKPFHLTITLTLLDGDGEPVDVNIIDGSCCDLDVIATTITPLNACGEYRWTFELATKIRLDHDYLASKLTVNVNPEDDITVGLVGWQCDKRLLSTNPKTPIPVRTVPS